jgi:hypothetical protein
MSAIDVNTQKNVAKAAAELARKAHMVNTFSRNLVSRTRRRCQAFLAESC